MKSTTIDVSCPPVVRIEVHLKDDGCAQVSLIQNEDPGCNRDIVLRANERRELMEALRLEPKTDRWNWWIWASWASAVIAVSFCLIACGGMIGEACSSRYVPVCKKPEPGSTPAFWPSASSPYPVARSIWIRVDELSIPATCGPYKKLYEASCGDKRSIGVTPGSAMVGVGSDPACIPDDWREQKE